MPVKTPATILDPLRGGDGYMSAEWIDRKTAFLRANQSGCHSCGVKGTELHVHHKNYSPDRKLWEYADGELVAMCADCHELWTRAIRAFRSEFSNANANEFQTVCGLLITLRRKHGDRWLMRQLIQLTEPEITQLKGSR